MKVLIVSTLYAPNEIGGAEATARMIAEGLVTRGHEAVAVSIAPDGEECERAINGVHCYYVELANIYWPHAPGFRPALWQKIVWHLFDSYNPVMQRKLGAILDREKPDVVHAHNLQGFSVSAWRAARRRNIPVVQTLHDYYLACPNSVMVRPGKSPCKTPCVECRVFGLPRRLLSNLPDTVTAVSKRTLTLLEGRGLFSRVRSKRIIHGGNPETAALPERTDRSGGHPLRFGFLGRLEPVKGLEVVMDAMQMLAPDAATLLIGGKGAPDYMAKLKEGSQTANITFAGFIRPEEFFPQIDVLIVPSLWEEPCPRVVHEAFGYRVPVFASRIGGIPEMVKPGMTGELFAPGDAQALARLMQEAAGSGRLVLRYGAHLEKARKNHEAGRILGAYESALADAAAQRNRNSGRGLSCKEV